MSDLQLETSVLGTVMISPLLGKEVEITSDEERELLEELGWILKEENSVYSGR